MAVLTNPTDLARETLKLLASRRIAPTPENFTRLYHEIAGTRAATESADERIAQVVRQACDAYPALNGLARVARTLEERDYIQFSAALVALAGGREAAVRHNWGLLLRDILRQLEMRQTGVTLSRKREGLERLLIGFSNDSQLFDKLEALLKTWSEIQESTSGAPEVVSNGDGIAGVPARPASAEAETIRQLRELLAQTLDFGLAARLTRFPDLAMEARRLAQSAREATSAEALPKYATQLRQFFFRLEVRGEYDADLLDALLRLLSLLLQNIGQLVDEDKWLTGQVEIMREVIREPLTTDKINEAERRFKDVIYKQSMLKHSLIEAKDSLKRLVGVFVQRLSELTTSTTDYHDKVEAYVGRVEGADDVVSLKNIVEDLMVDTRSMQVDMLRYRDEMAEARRQAESAETRIRKLEAELEQVSEQVSQDQLTGALNRRGLEDAMQREMARAERSGRPLSVAVLDLDNFKRLNDTYGHQAGDEALIHLISVVRKTLRPTDIVARYGGEEFIILFSETLLEQAVATTKRLQRELTKRYFLHNNERLLITFSAGVAQLKPGDTQEIVFARADKAMYQAKLQGRNRVVVAD